MAALFFIPISCILQDAAQRVPNFYPFHFAAKRGVSHFGYRQVEKNILPKEWKSRGAHLPFARSFRRTWAK